MENTAHQTDQENPAIDFESMDIDTPNILHKGQLVDGTVIQIDNDFVWVNVGYKSEGKIPREEFEDAPSEGDVYRVRVQKLPDEGGELIVSKRSADASLMRSKIEEAAENDEILTGKVVREAKNGLKVDFNGIEAYVPLSHMELGRPLTNDQYLGKSFQFKIIKLEKGKNLSMVVSRKDILKAEREVKTREILERVNEGDVVEGTVKNITKVGVFVDLGGMDGLIRLDDISWKRGANPRALISEGDHIKTRVINVDQERQRIGLSLKDLQPDPFAAFSQEHTVDEIVPGKVVKLESFGAFVEVAEGVEGLLHVSELSWTKRINHPKEVLTQGSEIQVKILNIDRENRKLSLGFRQLVHNPFDTLEMDYPVGSQHSGKIVNINEYGIFVELPNGVEGLVRKDDITWNKKDRDAKSRFTPGEMVQIQILRVDKKSRKVALGIKQLLDNPIDVFKFNHPPGSKMTGKVVRIADYGAFVELEPGIEGMVHISQLSDKRVDKVTDVTDVGKKLNVKILEVNTDSGKISLSVKDYDKDIQKELLTQFKGEDSGTFRLGDMVDLSMFEAKQKKGKK